LKLKNNPLSVEQAQNLTGENRGMIFVTETPTGPTHARRYEEEALGSFSSVEHKSPVKPALRYDNPDGENFVKFDSAIVSDDGVYFEITDSKSKIAPPFEGAQNSLKDALFRVGLALQQNNASSEFGQIYRVFYDFPTAERAAIAEELIRDYGFADIITVRVRPASQEAQEEFKQLRR
jgi:filamentous hemagglutinin